MVVTILTEVGFAPCKASICPAHFTVACKKLKVESSWDLQCQRHIPTIHNKRLTKYPKQRVAW